MDGTVVRPCPLWLITLIRNSGLGSGESSNAFSPIRHAPASSCESWRGKIRGCSCIGRRSERTRLPDGSGVNREVHAPFCERPAGETPPAYSPLDEDEHGAAAGLGASRRTTGGLRPLRPLEHHDLCRRTQ